MMATAKQQPYNNTKIILLLCLTLIPIINLLQSSKFTTTINDDNTSLTRIINKKESLPQPPNCSDAQLDALYSGFKMRRPPRNHNQRYHTPLMRHTHCPSESWARDYFKKLRGNSFLGVNVGCNKGLDAVEMAQLLSRDNRLSVKDWNKAMGAQTIPACGVPRDVKVFANSTPSTGKVHCIEPVSSTVSNLKKALRELKYEDYIVVTQAAVSNYTGMARFPDSNESGVESKSLKDCENLATEGCVEIPAYSLDDYLRKHGVLVAFNNSDSSASASLIDMLLIDAEGFDYEVLQGARETLKRVRYLLFEVNFGKNWLDHSLVETVKTILRDFTCYWAGQRRLWRITNCMNERIADVYELKSWSNVACVHQRETELAASMEEIWKNTIMVD